MTNEYTTADIEVWLSRSAFAQDIIRRAFARCFVVCLNMQFWSVLTIELK